MREDLSNYLVHWTKGNTDEESYQSFLKICISECIYGSNGRGVYGHDNVICFSEAPAKIFHSNLKGQLKPFGVSINKHDVFNLGGLPVIYQPREHLKYLNEEIHWRHVDLNLTYPNYRDFSWQREWRIKTDKLKLDKIHTALLVPNKYWADRLKEDIKEENYKRECDYICMLGYGYAAPQVLSGNIMIIDLKII